MMDNVRYRPSKFALLPLVIASALVVLIGQLGCATVSSAQASGAAVAAASALPASVDAKAELRGEVSSSSTIDGSAVLLVVRIPKGMESDKLVAEFEGTKLPLFPFASQGEGAYGAVVGIPHDHKPGVAEVVVTSGERKLRLPIQIEDGKYASETLKVSERKVNPRKSDMIRIEREVKEVGLVYSTITKQKYWDGKFVLPIDSDVTSQYGTKRLYNGQKKNFHNGLDLKAAIGTPIHAPAGGKVVLAKNLFFTGWTVLLDHGYGLITLYAHMSKLKVAKGQVLKPGQLIGLAGMTGRVTGPHLHWGAIINKVKVNPIFLTRVLK